MNKVEHIFTESPEQIDKMFEDNKIIILEISNYGLGGYTVWFRHTKGEIK